MIQATTTLTRAGPLRAVHVAAVPLQVLRQQDRKSTRLNSSH